MTEEGFSPEDSEATSPTTDETGEEGLAKKELSRRDFLKFATLAAGGL